jgi:O-methyltransferase involved in polyketide biosynthesis
MTTLTGVPRTMLLTTRSRVEEHAHPERLFQDPLAVDWWQSIEWDAELDRFYDPIVQFSGAHRAKLFDQIVERHLQAHPEGIVVELGAGLSTRFHRVGQACRCWIDLDLPEVTALKEHLNAGSEHHRLMAQSALEFSWLDQLPPVAPQQLLVIAEGLLMYFTFAQVTSLVEQLRQRYPGATLAFDVLGGLSKGRTSKILATLGAPLQWFVKNERDVEAMGVALVQTTSLVEANFKYPRRIGLYRWVPWLCALPTVRNANLILTTTVLPLASSS